MADRMPRRISNRLAPLQAERRYRKSEPNTMIGTVKTWLPDKHYGFISGSDGNDAFVHCSDIKDRNRKSLSVGERVQFEPQETEKGLRAANVRIVEGGQTST